MKHRVTHPALMLGIVCGLVGGISGCGDHKRTSAPPVAKAKEETVKPAVPSKDAPPPEEQQSKEVPRAAYDLTRYDAGLVELGEIVTRQFVVRNEGNADMLFVAGRPNDPNAVKVTVDRSKIAPGEAGIATAIVDTSGLSVGKITAKTPIGVGDPNESTIRFAIDLELVNQLKFLPDLHWRLGDMSGSNPMNVKGKIYSSEIDHFSVTGIQSSSEYLQANYRELEAEELSALGEDVRCGYEIAATISAQIPAGIFVEDLTIETDHRHVGSEEPVAKRVRLIVKRIGPVRIFGPRFDNETMVLYMNRVDAKLGKKHELTMLLRGAETREVKILDISSTDKAVKLHVDLIPASASTPNRRYKLTFEIPPNTVLPSESHPEAYITVKTDMPGAETIKFRVIYAPI